MGSMISFVRRINAGFWGDDVYQWWFYLAIVVILLFDRKKMEKRVYGVYPLCFLLALCMPVTRFVMEKVVSGANAYYTRLFSMLPVSHILMLGAVLLMDVVVGRMGIGRKILTAGSTGGSSKNQEEKRPVLKLVFTAGLCILMVLGGTDIYKQGWFRKAQNLAKVPNEAIEICRRLHRDEGVTIAVPDTLSSYIRQIDAGIYMPYGRYVNTLGRELSKEHPDLDFAMTEAGAEGCDYFVTLNNQENLDNAAAKAVEPYAQIDRYLVFEVNGVSRIKNYYDAQHRLIRTTTLDEKGNPAAGEQGYASIYYEYDRDNNRIREYYLDQEGNRMTVPGGHAGISWTYTHFSHQISSETYLDEKDQPVCAEGYAQVRYEYNGDKKKIREIYCDEQGNPMLRTDGQYAIREIFYNKKGKETGERYYDTEGNPRMNSSGYAEVRKELDENDRIIRESYYDTQGEPCIIEAGYATVLWEYDESGNPVKEIYLDSTGNMTLCTIGYAEINREYNTQNRCIREIYLDENGMRKKLPDGHFGLARCYSAAGDLLWEMELGNPESRWVLTQYSDQTGSQAMCYSLVDTESGNLILIDGGWSENAERVKEIIECNGNRVRAWFLTHYHEDHAGAFNVLWTEFRDRIDTVYVTPLNWDDFFATAKAWDTPATFETFLKNTAGDSKILYMKPEDELDIGMFHIKCFNAYDNTVKEAKDISNNCSLMLKFIAGDTSVLFCGDIHGEYMSNYIMERYGDELKSDIVQPGHHGNNSMTRAFYEFVNPLIMTFDAPGWLMTGEKYKAKDLKIWCIEHGIQVLDQTTAPNIITTLSLNKLRNSSEE